jgi:hypothetical protein
VPYREIAENCGGFRFRYSSRAMQSFGERFCGVDIYNFEITVIGEGSKRSHQRLSF